MTTNANANHHWIFTCCLCADSPTFDGGRFLIEHLEAVHDMQRPIKIWRKEIAHIDARDWFQTDSELFDFESGVLVAGESHRLPRRGANGKIWRAKS